MAAKILCLCLLLAGSQLLVETVRPGRIPNKDGNINIGEKLDCLKELGTTSLGVLWYIQSPYAEWISSRHLGENESVVGGVVPELLNISLASCCRDLTTLHYGVTNYSQITAETNIISDVVYGNYTMGMPVSLPPQLAYQDNYVAVVQSPGPAYLVKKSYVRPDILKSLHDAQYLLLFVVATASLAGVLMWMTEHHTNNFEFPAAFPGGIFNGFWWAMVTMTTVGFGDKVPRSIVGRVIALVWMICGVVILTMFTATVTTSFTTATLNANVQLPGSNIAVLLGAPEYSYAVRKGANVTHHASTMVEGAQLVQDGTVEGLLVDQLILGDILTDPRYKELLAGLQVSEVFVNAVDYGFFLSPNGSSGRVEECTSLLVKNKQRDVYLAVQELTNAVEERHMTNRDATTQSITSVFKEDWEEAVIWCYGVVGVTLFFGLIFHFAYWRPKHKAALLSKRKSYQSLDSDSESPSPSFMLGVSSSANGKPSDSVERMAESATTSARIKEILERQFRELERLEFERETRMRQWEEKRRSMIGRHEAERHDMLSS